MTSQNECIERRCYLDFLLSKYTNTDNKEKNEKEQLIKSNTVSATRMISGSGECMQHD